MKDYGSDKLPDPDEIECLREDATGDYMVFCQHILRGAIGATKWRENSCTNLLTQFCPASLEIYAVMCYINCYDVWRERFNQQINSARSATTTGDNQDKRQRMTFKYTVRGAKRNEGWSKAGIQKYNELLTKVKAQRQRAATGTTFEDELRKKMIGNARDRLAQKQIRSDIPEAEDCLAEFATFMASI